MSSLPSIALRRESASQNDDTLLGKRRCESHVIIPECQPASKRVKTGSSCSVIQMSPPQRKDQSEFLDLGLSKLLIPTMDSPIRSRPLRTHQILNELPLISNIVSPQERTRPTFRLQPRPSKRSSLGSSELFISPKKPQTESLFPSDFVSLPNSSTGKDDESEDAELRAKYLFPIPSFGTVSSFVSSRSVPLSRPKAVRPLPGVPSLNRPHILEPKSYTLR